MFSIGIGGHINKEQDKADDVLQTIHNGLKRELLEETGVPYEKFKMRFCGLINEEKSKVGKTHLGLVYCLQAVSVKINFHFGAELAINGYETIENVIKKYEFEHWSGLALRLI